MIDRGHNGGCYFRIGEGATKRQVKRSIWPGSRSTVVNAMRKHARSPVLSRLLTKTTTATAINVAVHVPRTWFSTWAGRERGRKREIDREEVISITLIPRDFAVLGYWFQAGLWSMLNDHHLLRFYIENVRVFVRCSMSLQSASRFFRTMKIGWFLSEETSIRSFKHLSFVERIFLGYKILFLGDIKICGIFIKLV